jgi:hypothetical protein
MLASMTPFDAAKQAFAQGDLREAIRGDWPYFLPEAYMAPSSVPTNWGDLLSEGLSPLADQADAQKLSRELQQALLDCCADPEGLYAAMAFLRAYVGLRDRHFVSPKLQIDPAPIKQAIRDGMKALEPKLRASRPSWMDKESETLWDRVARMAELLGL